MRFVSTNHVSPAVGFREAALTGLAPDGGLYLPESIPHLPESFWRSLPELSFTEVAFQVSQLFLRDTLDDATLKRIVTDAFDFDVPLVSIEDTPQSVYSLELFHGPTLAFKDFGARLMARLTTALRPTSARPLTILVATSGDTGGAVAAGFYRVPHTRVVVLYPKGQVSEFQERQFTTLGENISAVAVDGTFDDCQRLVKEAFLDAELRSKVEIAPANSINIARLLPQSFYHIWARARLGDAPAIFSVPSGNFGNLAAGLLAQKMGMPNVRYIAATNANDIVPSYLKSGKFSPRSSRPTLSTAMDVGNPSNFARILSLYSNQDEAVQRALLASTTSDEQTGATIEAVYRKNNYLLDPHSAVAYHGLMQHLPQFPSHSGVIFATAHPCKFSETVRRFVETAIDIPPQGRRFLEGTMHLRVVGPQYEEIKAILVGN